MDLIHSLIDFILHLDVKLAQIISQYGAWTYGILFFIIFMETGFVVTPFLPGDSLLFAAGSFAAPKVSGEAGPLNIWVLLILLSIAAVLGDTVNYWIGHYLGDRAYNVKWIKREYLDRTHAFFEKHGGKTIFLARFVPIVRTFAPFVAGMGKMSYSYFFSYNVFGGITWVFLFTLMGYFFGSLPFVQKNFELVIVAILLISVVPIVYEFIKARRESKAEKASHEKANLDKNKEIETP
jgi:membrane-associated protein